MVKLFPSTPAIIKIMGTLAQVELYRLIDEANGRGERVVVATVAHTRGSTPQRRGAKMLFFENGEVAGTVGGGCIEAEVWAEARETLRTGAPALHEFKLTATSQRRGHGVRRHDGSFYRRMGKQSGRDECVMAQV